MDRVSLSLITSNFVLYTDINVSVSNDANALEDNVEAPMPLYFDFQATTPMDPRVLDRMLPFLTNNFGNPHSKSHKYGWDTEQAVEKSRDDIADLIGAQNKEIIFTSGATESNNLSLKGVAQFYGDKKKHIITT